MWSGRYSCPVPYINSNLIKSFISIISWAGVFDGENNVASSNGFSSTKNNEIVQSRIMTTNEDSCLNCVEETPLKAVLRLLLERFCCIGEFWQELPTDCRSMPVTTR